MARSKPVWLINLEYYPLRGLFGLLEILPQRLSYALCLSLLRAVLICLPRRRRLMDQNLALCFPDRNRKQRDEIALASVKNLARGMSFFSLFPRLSDAEWQALVQMEGFEHLEKALAAGKGVLNFTAHYGCWEVIAAYVPRYVPGSGLVVRPLDNPRLDALILGVRSSAGGVVISKRNVLRDGIRMLRNRQLLGILIDQNFAPGNLFVDFFGRPAATTSIISLLARRTGCAVIPIHTEWEGAKIRLIFDPPLELSQNSDPSLAVAEDTQVMTKIVEEWIRKDPAQWLWLHNRWKRRPEPGELVYSRSQ